MRKAFNIRRGLLFAMNCKLCSKEFIYCINSGNDFRCYSCKKGPTPEDVERELGEMSSEEYQSFMEDIEKYELEHGKIEEDL